MKVLSLFFAFLFSLLITSPILLEISQASELSQVPVRNFNLNAFGEKAKIDIADIWERIIKESIKEKQFIITSQPGPWQLIAIGKEYNEGRLLFSVPARQIIAISIRERAPKAFDCYITVQTERKWKTTGWKKKYEPKDEKAQELEKQLGSLLNQKYDSFILKEKNKLP